MKKFTIILSVAVSLFFAGLLGYIYWLEYGLWAIAVWAAMIVALPFSSLMHELGHMLFGVFVKIRAVPKLSLFGASSCKIIPKTDQKLKYRIILAVCGGLIVNALLFVLGFSALYFTAVPVWISLLMPANVYLYILNAMPVQFDEGKTDGLIRWELLTGSDSAKVMLAVLTVQAQVLNGTLIEEVDENLLFGVPQIQEDDPSFIALTELRYEYYKAKGEEETARKYKDRFEELKKEYK